MVADGISGGGITPYNLKGQMKHSDSGCNISFIGGDTKSPSFGRRLGLVGENALGLLLTGVVCHYAAPSIGGGGGGTTEVAELTPEQEMEKTIKGFDDNLSLLEGQIEAYKDLIKQNNEDIAKFNQKDQLGKDLKLIGETKDKAKSDFYEAQKTFNNAESSYESAKVDVANAQQDVDTYQKEYDECDDEELKSQINEQLDNSKKELEIANNKLEAAETAKKEAEENLSKKRKDLNDTGEKSIENQIKHYINLENELAGKDLEAIKEENKTYEGKIKELKASKTTGEVGKEKAKKELTNYRIKKSKATKNAAGQYANADAADGNWWKRNMPKWLGGSDKATRMKLQEQHARKNEAAATLSGLGTSQNQYIQTRLTQFMDTVKNDDKYKNREKDVLKCLKTNPKATDTEIKAYLDDPKNK